MMDLLQQQVEITATRDEILAGRQPPDDTLAYNVVRALVEVCHNLVERVTQLEAHQQQKKESS